MIDGITILNQVEIEEPSLTLMIVGGALSLILCLIVFGLNDTADTFTAILSFVVAVTVTVLIYNATIAPTGRYKYECLISEDVSFVEVYDKYEILEKKGNIYVLEDREVEE